MASAAEASLSGLPKSLSPEFNPEIALAQSSLDQPAVSDAREPVNPGRKFRETGKKRES
jgi:hypothetical protein